MTNELILVLDFGSQYTQLIAQRIRENHVFSRIVPYNISVKEIKQLRPKGIIFSGGSNLAYNKKSYLPQNSILKLNIPILGICYGASAIVQLLGGRLKMAKSVELERKEVFVDSAYNLFWQMPGNITCLMSLSDNITKLPGGFKKTAHTQSNPIASFECSEKKLFGLLFHPEVVATQRGSQILNNFLYKVCGCIGTWRMDYFIKDSIAEIKKTVGKSKAIINLTPELSSFVAALLVAKAIGKRLKCVFINNGLMHSSQVKQIKKIFPHTFPLNLIYRDRSSCFLQNLKEARDRDEKRKIISLLSVKLFEEEVKKSKGTDYLVKETMYSDIIKQARCAPQRVFRQASKQKGGSFASGILQKLRILEPLKDLFIQEIKIVAKELGLPDGFVSRHPFPPEGLALRIAGEVTASRLKILQEADSCLVDELKDAGLYEQVWQSYAVLIPPENVIVIRCLASTNGISADWVRLPYDVLEKIGRRILSKVKAVSRVVYDISPHPTVAIEWE